MSSHAKYREQVCACCLNSSGKKPARQMASTREHELKKLLPDYDMHDSRYPNGLCMSCLAALNRFKCGKTETVSNFVKYDPAPINVDKRGTKCMCFICKKGAENGLAFVKKHEKVEELLQCEKCLTKRSKGVSHECTRQKLCENILQLDQDILDMVASEHLRRKGEDEMHLKNIQGGKPLIVSLGKKQDPQTKTTYILTHENANDLEKDLDLSEVKMKLLLTRLRGWYGKHSVEPYWRECVAEENGMYQDFFTLEMVDKFEDKGKPIVRPWAYAKNVPGLFEVVAKERGYDDWRKLSLKIGCDSGKGHTKVIAELYDPELLKRSETDPKAKKQKTDKSMIGCLKTITIGTGPDIPESIHNVKIMYEKLKMKELRAQHTGDFKMVNISVGVGPCSSKQPCGYCEACKVGGFMVYEEGVTKMRTEDNIVKNNTAWKNRKGKFKNDTTAKNFMSCVGVPLFYVEEGGLILQWFPPGSLHIRLGLVNKILLFLHVEWEKIAEGENGVDKFLASVNIHKKNYFGLTLGNVHK